MPRRTHPKSSLRPLTKRDAGVLFCRCCGTLTTWLDRRGLCPDCRSDPDGLRVAAAREWDLRP